MSNMEGRNFQLELPTLVAFFSDRVDTLNLEGRALLSSLPECFQRIVLGVMHFEYSQQLGHLEKIPDTFGKVCQFYRAAGIVRRRVESHQSTEATRIDVIHFAQVQHNPLISVGYCLLHFVSQQSRFFSEHNPAACANRENAIYRSFREFQLHNVLLRGRP
jgi:hypothetical protein